MKKLSRNALVILFSLIMAQALLPTFITPAQAANFTAGTWSELQTAMTAAIGHADAASTITITATIALPQANCSLNGTGKTITLLRGTSSVLIQIGSYTTLTLSNIIIDGNKNAYPGNTTRLLNMDTGGYTGTLTISSGTIVRNNAGGGIQIIGGTFNMNSGEISSNSTSGLNNDGAGVRNSGTFTMSGGIICNNSISGGYGGGVANFSTFNMADGEINGNASTDADGVYNFAGTFTMTSGKINGNSGGNGAGVFNNSRFTMTGGEINNNNR